MATNKLQWKRIAKGDRLPCDSLLMKKDGTIPSVVSGAGVKVGQDAYYLPVEEIRALPKEKSKDEGMIDKLIAMAKCYTFEGEEERQRVIAWLEKQGEHDSIEEPNFFDDFRKTDSEVEQKPAWSEEDIETIERIVCILDGIRYYNTVDNKQEKPYQSEINFLESFKDRVQSQLKQEWKQENTDDLTDFENAMMHIGGSFFGQHAGLDPNDTNAIKEQANILLELVPKQEWSEEDEDMINSIIRELIHQYNEEIPQGTEDEIKWLKNKLKSLRPQNHWKPSGELDEASYHVGIKRVLENPKSYGLTKYNWKPSDEQIYEFTKAVDYYTSHGFPNKILNELLKQLKNL